jgi:hypothetical protein
LPPRWALLGTLLIIFRLGVSSYWMNSYWGGSLAAAAGALVLGALPRIRNSVSARYAILMGIGLAVLANTRPVEGAVFSLLMGVALLAWMLGKRGPERRVALRGVVVPLALTLALAGVATGYYFARVTSRPWVAPYVLYRNTMSIAPHFIWQRPTPEPLYNNRELRNFYVYWEMSKYDAARNWNDLWRKLSAYWRFYIGPLLSIPLLSIVALWRNPKTRPLLWMVAGFSTVLIGQVWHNPHYAAPATGLVILIVMAGMRYLRIWRRHGLWGIYLVRSLPWASAAMLVIQVVSGRQQSEAESQSWRWPLSGNIPRANLQRQLEQMPEDHLVFVRYGRGHDLGEEWVYNSAEIDHARVIWARELNQASNSALIRYFSGRKVWLVEPDQPSPRAIPYEAAPMRSMPFVQLGAPGIAALRSPSEVRQHVLEKSGADPDARFNCDVWNFYFTEVTGVAGPEVSKECYGAGTRSDPVSFDHWFAWIERQR